MKPPSPPTVSSVDPTRRSPPAVLGGMWVPGERSWLSGVLCPFPGGDPGELRGSVQREALQHLQGLCHLRGSGCLGQQGEQQLAAAGARLAPGSLWGELGWAWVSPQHVLSIESDPLSHVWGVHSGVLGSRSHSGHGEHLPAAAAVPSSVPGKGGDISPPTPPPPPPRPCGMAPWHHCPSLL